MILNTLILLALAVTGFAAVAAIRVVRKHARRPEAATQHKTELQTWEGEGGNPAAPRSDASAS
jgi:hypothetical protein